MATPTQQIAGGAANAPGLFGHGNPMGSMADGMDQWAIELYEAARDMVIDVRQAPEQLEQVSGFVTRDGALGSAWGVASALLAAVLLGLGLAMVASRFLAPARGELGAQRPESAGRALVLALRGLLLDLVPVLVFYFAALSLTRLGFGERGMLFSAPEGLRLMVRSAVTGATVGWITFVLAGLPVGAGRPGLRLLAIDDAEAEMARRFIGRIIALGCGGWIIAVIVYLLRFGTGLPHLILIATSVAVGVVSLAGLRRMRPARGGVGRFWRPLAVVSVFGLGATWIIGILLEPLPPLNRVLGTVLVLALLPTADGLLGFALGRLNRRLMSVKASTRVIFVPVGEADELRAIEQPVEPASIDTGAGVARAVEAFVGVVREAASWIIMLVAVLGLARAWSIDLRDILGPSSGRTTIGAGLDAALTLLVGWYAWKFFEAGLALRLARDDAGEFSRARTIQPLLSSVGRFVIGALALMAALSALGINIAPLIASAGVVGIAVGFGAQTLVRDLFSGAFFLIEDVFRIGDYVEAANNAKGTVEKITFRTVALRHQNGPLHFVPYGVLGSVRNNSRDWVIDKFELPLPVDVDSEKVRKMIKRIGEEMLVDAPCAADIVEPLKAKLYRVQPGAKIFRCKVQTPPGRQFEVRAEALKRIEAAMKAAGMRFADPTPQVTINTTQPMAAEGQGI